MTRPRRSSRGRVLIRIAALCAAVTVGGCSAAARSPDAETDRFAARYIELAAALVDRDPDSSSGDTATPAKAGGGPATRPSLAAIAVQAKMMADQLRSM